MFRLRGCPEDDTIFSERTVVSSELWSIAAPVLPHRGGFILYNVKDLVLLRGLHIID